MIVFLVNTDGESVHCLIGAKEQCNLDDAQKGEKLKKVDFRRAAAEVIINKYSICEHCIGEEPKLKE